MHYLGLALYAEGKTDYYFLAPLLQRLCEDVCLGAGLSADISEVLPLDDAPEAKDAAREWRILDAARRAQGSWRLLFVHADGANDPMAKHTEQVAPALRLIEAEFGMQGCGVAVVPIRETEAWVIADGNALRLALGSVVDDRVLGLPITPRAAEGVPDPKAVFEAACLAARPAGRRRAPSSSVYLGSIGEQVSLERLRGTQSFRALEAELRAALARLGVVT